MKNKSKVTRAKKSGAAFQRAPVKRDTSVTQYGNPKTRPNFRKDQIPKKTGMVSRKLKIVL